MIDFEAAKRAYQNEVPLVHGEVPHGAYHEKRLKAALLASGLVARYEVAALIAAEQSARAEEAEAELRTVNRLLDAANQSAGMHAERANKAEAERDSLRLDRDSWRHKNERDNAHLLERAQKAEDQLAVLRGLDNQPARLREQIRGLETEIQAQRRAQEVTYARAQKAEAELKPCQEGYALQYEALGKYQAEVERLKAALILINGMGAVCEDFLECTHASCRDSCGAKLAALAALEGSSEPLDELVREYQARYEASALLLGETSAAADILREGLREAQLEIKRLKAALAEEEGCRRCGGPDPAGEDGRCQHCRPYGDND